LSIKDIASSVAWRFAGSRPILNHAGAVVETSLGSGTTASPERGQPAAQISREVVQLHVRLYGTGLAVEIFLLSEVDV